MPTPVRLAAAMLLAALCGCQQQQKVKASYHCADQVTFRYDRQSQTVELTRNGQSYQGIMDEKGLLTWPKANAGQALPDSFFISRKTPDQMKLYGGFAGTGKACRQDPG
ncbi:hypothetical protein KIF53_22210 [Chromobacterium subtsugae]|uniref:C-type lysozyme inhibitor domain-containing protein n=1 Tax=Chromobacterium subtsugae TaxID=251747 RepID=A0ABS7FJV3_9NEIS|nr:MULTISPECIES: hypothetical protein [Chromobacterium]KUM02954.1 hypothetical protein Cv017_22740 [Chromobacterium subtsugae]KZE84175.1 hypothetical protein AWB61_05500 [Chromobacterium sp. F49]MBW7568683.1 hypothetical protein [Chromobacterium subtsugae]MBW8290355.1 hypothetical protein [Chromobacterium subtsugae]WSE93665.1 hypothetical protein U6115_10625 [Chromobacterium subtsugae]